MKQSNRETDWCKRRVKGSPSGWGVWRVPATIKGSLGTVDIAQQIEFLLSLHETLGLVPGITDNQRGDTHLESKYSRSRGTKTELTGGPDL